MKKLEIFIIQLKKGNIALHRIFKLKLKHFILNILSSMVYTQRKAKMYCFYDQNITSEQ